MKAADRLSTQLSQLKGRLLFARYRRCRGLEVELSFALLVQHAFTPGAAATDMDPVGRHGDHRARTEIFGRIRVRARVPRPANDHIRDLATM